MEGGSAGASPAASLRPRLSDAPAIPPPPGLQVSRATGGQLHTRCIVSEEIIRMLIIVRGGRPGTVMDTGQAFPFPDTVATMATASPRRAMRLPADQR
jgi:hypothetical protein